MSIPIRRQPKKPVWNTEINLQRLLMWLAGIVLGGFVVFHGLEGRVQRLEDHDNSQDARMTRLEGAIQELRSDNQNSARDIASNVKDLANKIDQLKDTMFNQFTQHPELQKWSK